MLLFESFLCFTIITSCNSCLISLNVSFSYIDWNIAGQSKPVMVVT
jgi:hypothetical protein